MSLLLLAACSSSTPTTAPAPEPEPAEPVPAVPAEAKAITIEPLGIRWNAERQTVQIEAKLAGPGLEQRTEVVHVGVTVVTEGDVEIDLLVHSLFPAALDESLLFSTSLPEPPKHVLIGAWSQKIEPCAVDRPGCREFGFVLDGSLGSFPKGLYTEGRRQRLLPADLTVATTRESAEHLERARAYASVFGSQVDSAVVETSRAPGVWVQRADDLPWAEAVAPGIETHVDPQIEHPMLLVLPQ